MMYKDVVGKLRAMADAAIALEGPFDGPQEDAKRLRVQNELDRALGYMADVEGVGQHLVIDCLEAAKHLSRNGLYPGAVAFGLAQLGEEVFRRHVVECWGWCWIRLSDTFNGELCVAPAVVESTTID